MTRSAPRLASRAAIYLRISEDDGTALGVERQRSDCIALAEVAGLDVVEVYTDNDVSAYTGNVRPQYQALVEAIRGHRVDAVVCYHLDRLHRSPRELEEFIDLCLASHVTHLHTCSGTLDLRNTDELFTVRILGAVARKSSDDASRRIRRKLQDLADRGLPHGGVRAFGYDAARLGLVADEAAAIRVAADRLLEGWSVGRVLRDWRDRGVTGPRGGEWRRPAFVRMMTSGRIAGLREVHVDDPARRKIVGPAAWPAIITPQELTDLRHLLGGHLGVEHEVDVSRRSHGNLRVSLLIGFVYCGHCGRRLSTSSDRGTRRYQCIGPYGCGLSITGAQTDSVVEALVFAAVEAGVLDDALVAPESPVDLTLVERGGEVEVDELATIDRSLADLAGLFGSGVISRDEWLAARAPFQARRDSLAAAASTPRLVSVPPVHPLTFRDAWATWGLDQRRAMLDLLIRQVRVRRAERRGARFDRERISVEWKT